MTNKASYSGSRQLFSWDPPTSSSTCSRFNPSSRFLLLWQDIEILEERKFTSSLFVCKEQATVAGDGDRKSNEALELPQPPHRMTSNARIDRNKVEQLQPPKMDHFWSDFNLKISLHWSDQISTTFEAYIPPPYIVIGLVIPIMLTVIWKNQWEGIFLILKNWDQPPTLNVVGHNQRIPARYQIRP